jgi:hypothetical protein
MVSDDKRLGKRECASPEGTAGDGTLAAEIAKSPDVVERGYASRRQHRQPAWQDFAEELEIRPGERAVSSRPGDEQPAHTCLGAAHRQFRRRDVGSPRPAFDGHVTVSRIDRDHQPLAKPRGRGRQELGREGSRPDHHTGGASRDSSVDRRERAVTAPDLNWHLLGNAGDAVEQARRRMSSESAIEVHEMEPPGALGDKATRKGDGIATLDRHSITNALMQAHSPSVENVNSRYDLESGHVFTC